MGDRISISFAKTEVYRDGKEKTWESTALFSHWNGRGLLATVSDYLRKLQVEIDDGTVPTTMPLGRLEPGTVMVDFILWLGRNGYFYRTNRVLSNYYLGKDEHDGDNSDNGHFRFHLDRAPGKWLD